MHIFYDCSFVCIDMSLEFKWNVETEIELLTALTGRRPIGLNKHFIISEVCSELQSNKFPEISTKDIWTYLHNLYDFKKLEEHMKSTNDDLVKTLNSVEDFKLPTNDEILEIKKEKNTTPKRRLGRPSNTLRRSRK